MKKMILLINVLILPIILNSCAFNIVHVKQTPVTIEQKSESTTNFSLEKEVKFSLGTGYSRSLKAKTNWKFVGSIPQDDVFKTKDQILTIEGSNIYEAYIVVKADNLVGFYLPAEKTFSILTNPLVLNINR